MAEPLAHPNSFIDDEEPKSSKVVWDALCEAEREFQQYYNYCDRIDKIIDAAGELSLGQHFYFSDQEFDLFWASLEILKPAVYSRPPQPVVAPRFQDRNRVATTASELLERCLVSSFERGDFDQVMLNVRDDLVISGRGVTRITYETDEEGGGKRVCDEHVDRCDFLHEPARKWSEVGWVAFAGYLTEREFRKRFPNADVEKAQFNIRRDSSDGHRVDTAAKCKVWEVWHKADKRVYWVTEGVDTFLDESEPFLRLEGFFPCPRPAYGVLKRRSLIPVPDYVRYERTLEQINDITRRIHGLLDWVRVRGLIPAGGDVSDAVETALSQNSDDVMLIPVPGAALMQGSNGNFVQFLPLQDFATTIQGLIEARRELINNFYELSGISDIMRGATEAEETLGAQQLKSQYGSIRVREKIDELQRLARDVARISAEIIAEKFDQETLLDMAQMTIPTRAEVDKSLKELEQAAKDEMEQLAEQAREAAEQARASGEEIDPQRAELQFQQAQQAILEKYQPQIAKLRNTVVIEDVMQLLRNQKARAFTIEIETDSTIMTDEMAEKQSRAEFLTAFANASAAVQPLLAAGESGAKLAGGMIKFALAPFRAGRELDALIDEFVEQAPQALAQQGEGEEDADLAAAQMRLAEAEMQKAQAQIAKVQADAALKEQEIQLRGAEAQAKAQEAQQKFQLEVEETRGKIAETQARIEKIYAEIQLAQQKLGLEAHREEREDLKTAADIELRATDQAMQAQNAERDAAFRAQESQRADR